MGSAPARREARDEAAAGEGVAVKLDERGAPPALPATRERARALLPRRPACVPQPAQQARAPSSALEAALRMPERPRHLADRHQMGQGAQCSLAISPDLQL